MKVVNFLAVSIVFLCFQFGSCKNKSSQSVTDSSNKEELIRDIPKGKYGIKSGIVEYKTSIMGMDAKQIITFDDFGKTELTEVIMDVMGVKIHSATLNTGGFVYNYDVIKKSGTKTSVTTVKTPDIDFENMTKEMMQDMNIKKHGSENFLGKNCQQVSIDSKKLEMKGNYLIYKGIPLKVNTDVGTIKMILIAEKFIENPAIPTDKFRVPSDVEFTEQ